mgnify:FL=1
MLKALSNTVAQLSEPSLRKILFYSVLLALASIVICSGLGWVLLDQFGLLGFGFLDSFLPWIGASLIIVIGLVFFPSTIMLVASLFSDRIIRAVEEKYYPEKIGTVHVPLTTSIKTSLTLIVIASIVNICLLPFYALGMILPGLSFIIFYLGNGYLLGRELFETVAQRHLPAKEARKLRKQYFLKVLIGGGLITFLATLPLVNLFAPIIGTVLMVHFYHNFNKKNG